MRVLGCLLVLLLLFACGQRTKHDVLQKADGVETKQQLADALGAPDDRSKFGPLETWTYEASDGIVTFLITGDSVSLQATRNHDLRSAPPE